MNAFKMNKNTKTGKSAAPVHQSTINGSSHIKGISPTSAGPLSTFYSAGPVLSLKGLIQPKLTIGQPNDRYEQEADRVADQVMRMPEPKGSLASGQSSLVQRKSGCPECIQRMVRDSYVSCQTPTAAISAITGPDPVGTIRAANERAVELADEVLNELIYTRERIIDGEEVAWPTISDVIAQSLRTRFQLDPDDRNVWTGTGPGTVDLIITRLQSVKDILDGGWIRYTCLSPARITTTGCSGPCCVDASDHSCACPGEYRIWLCQRFWEGSTDEQALTLIHEAFHIYYGWPNHPARLTNAYCFEMLVIDYHTLSPGLTDESQCS